MARNVVVVESPAKAKTIGKSSADYEILASYGHVRDLVPKEGADPEHGYAMKYEIIDKNSKHVDAIARAVRKADALYPRPTQTARVKPSLASRRDPEGAASRLPALRPAWCSTRSPSARCAQRCRTRAPHPPIS